MMARGDATGKRDSIMSQFNGDYGVQNKIGGLDRRSPNLFAQIKSLCGMKQFCTECDLIAKEYTKSGSYTLQQCKDACMTDSSCYGIDYGKKDKKCRIALSKPPAAASVAFYDGYVKDGCGMAETEVGGRTYYREEGQVGEKNVGADILDSINFQEGQVGAKVHPGSIRGKETEVGYRNYHEEGQVGDKNVRAPIFDWQKTQEGQVGEKNVGADILDSINFQEGQVGEKNVG